MSKIAFVFPGQGAQEADMAKDIIEEFEECKELFDEANDVLDFDLYDLMYGDNEQLHRTSYTQPALVVASTVLLKAFGKLSGIKPDYVAGLSLGEYTALVASGAMDFVDAVQLVRKRGQYMEAAGNETQGAMSAVIRPNKELVEQICAETEGTVSIANYNSPAQIVISGEKTSVTEVNRKLKEQGVKVIPLKVSGAFHSDLMKSASDRLAKALDEVEVYETEIPYVSNVDANISDSNEQAKELLVQQLTGTVRWEESVEALIDEGVDTFYEIGPGRTLAGLIKKINRKVKVVNINSIDSLRDAIDEMERVEV